MSRLKERYKSQIKKDLQEKFGYPNVMQIPRLKTIVLSMGIAEAAKDKNIVQQLLKEVANFTGQKPIVVKSKKAISNFKLRQGQPIGIKVTIRGTRMYDFLDRFCNIACPRIKDFRGFNPKCDGSGNYSLGLEDQQIFPEVDLDELKKVQGMNITFVTSAKSDEECVELLRQLGIPFKNLPIVVAA
jgi:large subunit ribosomal protein L5